MKKILSIMLTMAMLLTVVPAYAAGDDGVSAQAEANENRIVNGDFSKGSEGWSSVTAYGKTNRIEIGSNASTYSLTSADGNFCELQGYSDMVIYQTIEANPGETLVMEFDYAGRPGFNNYRYQKYGDTGAYVDVYANAVAPFIFKTTDDLSDFKAVGTTAENAADESMTLHVRRVSPFYQQYGTNAVAIYKAGYALCSGVDLKGNVMSVINSENSGKWYRIRAEFLVDASMVTDGKVNIGISSYSRSGGTDTNINLGGGNLIDNISVKKADAIYVQSTGDVAYPGTHDYPVPSLSIAWDKVADGGTIYVMDDLTNIDNAKYVASANFGKGNKSVTIKGINYDSTQSNPNVPTARTLSYYTSGGGTQGIVKFSGDSSVTFENITFNGNSNATCLYVGDANSTVTLGTGTSMINPGKGYSASGKDYINNLGTVCIGATQNLTSDGQIEGTGTIKRAAGFTGIMFKNSGAITTKSITFDGGAVYSGYDKTHGYPTGVTSGNGSKLFDATGALTLGNGTTIRNFASTEETAVIKAQNGLTINNGVVIENCYDTNIYGDIIEVYGTLNMTGGEIRKNYGTSYIVWMQRANTSIVNLSAGKLTDNCAAAGAIAVTSSNSNTSVGTTINISGSPEIKNNVNTSGKISNLYFDKGRTLNLTGAFSGNIGITCGDDNDICNVDKIFGTAASGVTYSKGFTNDKNAGLIAVQNGDKLIWKAPVATLLTNGVAGESYVSLSDAVNAYTDKTNQVIQMIADIKTTEDVSSDNDYYLDINGHTILMNALGSGNIFAFDSATKTYTDESQGVISGTGLERTQILCETTTSHIGDREMRFVKILSKNNDEVGTMSARFPRFNLQFYKYNGYLGIDSANMNAVWAFQGNSSVIDALVNYGCNDGTISDKSKITKPTGTTNPFFFTTKIFEIDSFKDISEFTIKRNLVGSVIFETESRTEFNAGKDNVSYLDILYLSYKKADEQTKNMIDKFVTESINNEDVTKLWNDIKAENQTGGQI